MPLDLETALCNQRNEKVNSLMHVPWFDYSVICKLKTFKVGDLHTSVIEIQMIIHLSDVLEQ